MKETVLMYIYLISLYESGLSQVIQFKCNCIEKSTINTSNVQKLNELLKQK